MIELRKKCDGWSRQKCRIKLAVHCSFKMAVSNLIIVLKLRLKKSTFKSIKNDFYFRFEGILQLIQFGGKSSRHFSSPFGAY